jgi:hypothetical protein
MIRLDQPGRILLQDPNLEETPANIERPARVEEYAVGGRTETAERLDQKTGLLPKLPDESCGVIFPGFDPAARKRQPDTIRGIADLHQRDAPASPGDTEDRGSIRPYARRRRQPELGIGHQSLP